MRKAEVGDTILLLLNRVRGPYKEIFVLTFKAYGPNEVSSQLLIRAFIYTDANKPVLAQRLL